MPKSRIKSRCLEDLTDQERLQDRLEWEGFSETKMKSDGNCQFRALADQLYQSSDSHKLVRQEIVKELKARPKSYKGLVDMEYSKYVNNMSSNSVWGDEVTLKAAADAYGVKIVLITSLKNTPSIVILPKSQKQPDRVIYLSYLGGIHFNSIHHVNGGSSSGSHTASTELQKNKKGNKKKNRNKKEKEELARNASKDLKVKGITARHLGEEMRGLTLSSEEQLLEEVAEFTDAKTELVAEELINNHFEKPLDNENRNNQDATLPGNTTGQEETQTQAQTIGNKGEDQSQRELNTPLV